jgi:hypothetical protein
MNNSQSNLPLGNGATPLFADPFTGSSTVENKWIVKTGAGSKSPGLTAGVASAPTGGIAGFAGATDTSGSGALRLTDATTNQSGAVIYNQNIFSKAGVSIEFEYFQYGGTVSGAQKGDGLSFFLINGAEASPDVGGFGGSLGYANRIGTGASAGAPGGYLGIGFDSYGNFSNSSEGLTGGIAGGAPDTVAIRGSAGTTYKYLTGSAPIAGGIDNAATGATRADSGRRVQITLGADGKLSVKFDFNKNGSFADAGETVIDSFQTIGTGLNEALPNSLKFGFAASTGDATNIHEIRELKISSVADVITGNGTISYTANNPPAVVAPTLTVSDVIVPTPTSTFNGASVGITVNYKTGQDFLTVGPVTNNAPATSGGFTGLPNLTWTFSAATGVLTIVGAGTPAEYQAALKQVAYYNNAGAAANISDRTAKYTLTGIPGAPSLDTIIKVGAGSPAAGRPEILFQNFQTGEVAIWAVDTKGVLTGAKFVTLGTAFGAAAGTKLSTPQGWRVVDTGDVDKDGVADILWYDPTSRRSAIHYMTNEGQIKAAGYIKAAGADIQVPLGEGWNPVGLGDVNVDGNLDVVWRSTALDVLAYWTVTGTNTTLAGGGFIKNAGGTADFKVGDTTSTGVKLGDFDGDGKVDVLLSNGKVALLGGSVGANVVAKGLLTLPSNGDTSLVVRAVGDYNGDGTTDLAWESTNADKQVLEYLKILSGSFDPAAANFKLLATTGTPTTWNIGASKDFNADVTPDLVWHNSVANGKTAIWAIDKTTGGFVLGGATAFVTFNSKDVETQAGWEVVGADDFGSVTLV